MKILKHKLTTLFSPAIAFAMTASLGHAANLSDQDKKFLANTSGLPVGLKADDGKTYLLIGEHKPLNSELAQYAAKKITVEGKVASREGVNMIENAVIHK
jgi:hypothetical protein